MTTQRVRFRFRLSKPFHVPSNEMTFALADREVTLAAQHSDKLIEDSLWLVMNVRGFPSTEEASAFGAHLKVCSDLASVATRLGIDVGVDRHTAGFGPTVKDKLRTEMGYEVRDNIHGLDIFTDSPSIRYIGLEMKGTVRVKPEAFIDSLRQLFGTKIVLSPIARDIILLMNYALMRQEPVARIVFAISAVEMIGQKEWSDAQKGLLEKLASMAESIAEVDSEERREVADAIRSGIHRVGLRQGVMRLLKAVKLENLRKKWDELYSDRSSLVHGLAPVPGMDYTPLADKVTNLCGHILLRTLELEGVSVGGSVEKYYPLSQ